ncbi:hypothetical protein KM043_014884 [Ampulex compressa]|nr:hypothetical protein KM043_014884 [Ampulex compressa]
MASQRRHWGNTARLPGPRKTAPCNNRITIMASAKLVILRERSLHSLARPISPAIARKTDGGQNGDTFRISFPIYGRLKAASLTPAGKVACVTSFEAAAPSVVAINSRLVDSSRVRFLSPACFLEGEEERSEIFVVRRRITASSSALPLPRDREDCLWPLPGEETSEERDLRHV